MVPHHEAQNAQSASSRRTDVQATGCRATRCCRRTRWPRSTRAGAGWSPRSASSSCPTARSSCSARPGSGSRTTPSSSTPTSCSSRSPRRRASSTSRPATPPTPSTSAATRWPSARSTARRSCARATYAATRPWTTSATSPSWPSRFDVLDSAGGVICEPNDTPLDSRHLDMTYALQTLTDKIYMGNVVSGRQRRRHHRDGLDPVRRARRDRADAGLDLADQLQLAAALGRPDARRAVRVLRGRPAGRADAVHPDGRDVAGDDPGRAGAADRRGAVGHRAVAADPPGRTGDLRVVPVQHRHAVGLADLRHARVGDRPALHRPDRAALRAAVPLRWRPDVVAGARRAGRLRGADDDAADVPRRRQLGDALGRLARGRPGGRLREVHRRHRDPADAAGRVHAAGDRRGVDGVRRARGGRPRRPLPRRDAHDGAVPHLLLPAVALLVGELRALDARRRHRHRRPRRRRSTRTSSRRTSRRRSTTPSARSSRSTSSAAARSSATRTRRGQSAGEPASPRGRPPRRPPPDPGARACRG